MKLYVVNSRQCNCILLPYGIKGENTEIESGEIFMETHGRKDDFPFYDPASETWKVVTEYGEQEGNVMYIASEFVRDGVIYLFHCEPPEKEKYHEHAHSFEGVVSCLLEQPEYFSVAGFEEYYSRQELEFLNLLKKKLQIPSEETGVEEIYNKSAVLSTEVTFGILKQKYLSQTDRLSICWKETMSYENYLCASDVPEQYDVCRIYGISMITGEFYKDGEGRIYAEIGEGRMLSPEYCIEVVLEKKLSMRVKNGRW